MIQKLPLELITLIASYLDFKSVREFAATCHYNYSGIIPVIWDQMSMTDTCELIRISNRLRKNSVWNKRAIQFVRKVSLCHSSRKKYSCNLAASMFGIARTELEQQKERNQELIEPHEHLESFGNHLLCLFPHLNQLVFDYRVAIRNFYLVDGNKGLSYNGRFSVVNFESDNAKNLYRLLKPFKKISQLRLQTIPVVSMCDDLDESILTNMDIYEIATFGFLHLVKLELAYLDSSIDLNLFVLLLQGLPKLSCLQLDWIFPPVKEDYLKLCQIIDQYASLYPIHIEKKSNIFQVTFSYKSEVKKSPDKNLIL